MADNKNKVGEFYTRPIKLGKWEGFKQFLWNGETSQFLGRTAGSWAKILLFYVLFYAVLAGFFAAMLAVFYQTLDENKPKWQLENGLIGNNPGLGFRPMPPESNVESTLVWFAAADDKNTKYWTEEIDTFLTTYHHQDEDENKGNRVDCDFESPPPEGKVCRVDVTMFSPCTTENRYNYPKGSPCVFLKLNKIFNWIPQYYNATSKFPEKMPEVIQNAIKIAKSDKKEDNMIWISCEGENPADVENLGPISYIPKLGFPGYFFPFQNQKGYMPPLLAIHFEKPKSGVLINIECKAWARNIQHDRADRRGSVHFELMVD
ncbi:unnamed protein product [Diamesa serratosioi]